jgi:hypothetical protein
MVYAVTCTLSSVRRGRGTGDLAAWVLELVHSYIGLPSPVSRAELLTVYRRPLSHRDPKVGVANDRFADA